MDKSINPHAPNFADIHNKTSIFPNAFLSEKKKIVFMSSPFVRTLLFCRRRIKE